MFFEKRLRKLSSTYFSMALLGKLLIIISLGSIFSRFLILYGLFILIFGVIIVVNYLHANLKNWHKKKQTTFSTHMLGYGGMMLLALFLGMQATFLPFKHIIFILGLVLIIPGTIQFFR
ncbi:hypothetical protein GOV09_01430 [Candidatus Woesearchaeota archaeon]|nr:hypothetical protein [Candidatus Woesearchaeota archaeon]